MSGIDRVAFWDRVAKKATRRPDRLDYSQEQLVKYCRRRLGAGQVVLDFGCGSGAVARALAGSAKQLYGIDISPRMIALARERAAGMDIANVEFACAGLERAPCPPGSVDMVVASGILHLLDQPGEALGHIHRMLKPGGLLVSNTGCLGERKSPVSIAARLLTALGFLPDMHFFTLAELSGLIADRRFDINTSHLLDKKFNNYLIVATKMEEHLP